MSYFGIGNIVNKTNGKQFIFKSTNVFKKIENTRHQLNFGCHYNHELQKDWDEFGPSNFNFNILESNLENEDDLNKRMKAFYLLHLLEKKRHYMSLEIL